MCFVEIESDKVRTAVASDGFVVIQSLLDVSLIADLHRAFDDLFNGVFETGVSPDEVNWQSGKSDPSLTRQICNGWRANRTIARVVLNEQLGEVIAKAAGWPGARLMQDNVLWKPPGAKALGFHQDSAFTTWFAPSEVFTCWIALDETSEQGGTIEFAKGSHRWALLPPVGEFHAPADHLNPMQQAAQREGVSPLLVPVEVKPGGGSFHHGRTWHGSAENYSDNHRRALVLHAMSAEAEYCSNQLSNGTGPIYGRYKKLDSNILDENYFPILWGEGGQRTAAIADFIDG